MKESRRKFTGLLSMTGMYGLVSLYGSNDMEDGGREHDEKFDEGRGLTVDINVPTTIYEGSEVVISVVVHNPHSIQVTDTVTVDGLRGEVFNQDFSLPSHVESREDVTLDVPASAGGHTGEITAASSVDTASETVTFSPSITPIVTEATVDNNELVVRYKLTNTGTAPGADNVVVTVNDDVVEVRNEFVGIGETTRFTTVQSLGSVDTPVSVTVVTGSKSDHSKVTF